MKHIQSLTLVHVSGLVHSTFISPQWESPFLTPSMRKNQCQVSKVCQVFRENEMGDREGKSYFEFGLVTIHGNQNATQRAHHYRLGLVWLPRISLLLS